MKQLTLILGILILVSCKDDFTDPLPVSDYLYSGSIQIMDNPQIMVNGEAYENSLSTGPLQVTVSEDKATDLFLFTIYGRKYGIYEADFWVNEAICLEFNEAEQTILLQDERGNDVIRVLFHEDFWDDCYYENEEERNLSFLIKSRKPFFE